MTQAELYVVATPLGNRLDITLRAMDCLKQADVLFAEDTREALKLLELCGIAAQGRKIHSYASHNLKRATQLAVELLQNGKRIALLTDRGTPGISDPGALLVAAAREAGIKVTPIPGPSAVTALVSVSGLAETGFVFWGFLPRENKPRQEAFDRMRALGLPVCFYESPRRVRETVEALKAAFPQGRLFMGRELTKIYEEFRWLDLAQTAADTLPEQGEYVFLLETGPSAKLQEWETEVRLRMASDREWSKDVASRHGIAAKQVYNALQQARASSIVSK